MFTSMRLNKSGPCFYYENFGLENVPVRNNHHSFMASISLLQENRRAWDKSIVTKMKTERSIIRSVFLMSKKQNIRCYEKCSFPFRQGTSLSAGTASANLAKNIVLPSGSSARAHPAGVYVPCLRWMEIPSSGVFSVLLMPLRIESEAAWRPGVLLYLYYAIVPFPKNKGNSVLIFLSSSLFRYLSANRRIPFCSSCLDKSRNQATKT